MRRVGVGATVTVRHGVVQVREHGELALVRAGERWPEETKEIAPVAPLPVPPQGAQPQRQDAVQPQTQSAVLAQAQVAAPRNRSGRSLPFDASPPSREHSSRATPSPGPAAPQAGRGEREPI